VPRLRGLALFGAIALRNAQAMDDVRHHAHHDALTALPNQRLLADRLDRAVAHAARGGERFAVLYLDLDRFKAVNDTQGHLVGDEVLRQVAARFAGCVRAEDTVARVGGDEFVVLLPRANRPEEAALVADKLRSTLSEPIVVDDSQVTLTVSVGIALFPVDGSRPDDLVGAADHAMYAAKRGGRDRVRWSSR